MENRQYLSQWIEYLNNTKFEQTIPHLENCIFIRNIKDDNLNKIFEEVYDKQISLKLKRDQMIFYTPNGKI